MAASDAEGVPRGRLRARDLSDPFRGVRIPIALLENADDDRKFTLLCDAYQAHLPATWFFSHATAARILGVPLPRRLERLEVHVSMPVPHQRPRGKWVRGHSAPQATVRRLNGRPVRAPAELWCELAPMLTLDQLIRAGDRMLSDNPFPLASHRQLAAAVKRHNTRPGARKLREALPLLRPRVWSPKETDVRLAMARAGLPEAANNEPIYDEHGRLVAIGDLVLKKFMTVVEYEGERWHRDERAVIDVDRFNKLSALGWTIVRIRKHHTTDDIVRMIRAALLLNGWQG
ncbi:MAG: hypothetical protein FWD85_04900 [Microbacteriaceae bacterium]|nr:hypothetical protein [Microbacteriaceae bacterium]MCL2794629.1 hypothetical protein [Microbacteriaceae bacterium]